MDSKEFRTEYSGYVHENLVLKQYSECLMLPPSKLFERLKLDGSHTDKIREETLVMLAREFRRRGNESLAWKLMLEICGRVQPSALRAVKLWRLTPTVAEDFIENLLSIMYDVILKDIDSQPFWEIRFWVCFERRLLSLLKKYRVQNDRYVQSDFDEETGYIAGAPPKVNFDQLTDPALRTVIAEGLSLLPDHLRTAFILKHWAGFPESGNTAEENGTIASIMGVSDRTVRNYLSRAEVLLNEWRRDSVTAEQDILR